MKRPIMHVVILLRIMYYKWFFFFQLQLNMNEGLAKLATWEESE